MIPNTKYLSPEVGEIMQWLRTTTVALKGLNPEDAQRVIDYIADGIEARWSTSALPHEEQSPMPEQVMLEKWKKLADLIQVDGPGIIDSLAKALRVASQKTGVDVHKDHLLASLLRDFWGMKTDKEKRPRIEVLWFVRAMEKKLSINDHKTHWRYAETQYLFLCLKQEVEQLERVCDAGSVSSYDAERILEEAVDVANICMMIADKAQLGLIVPR